jgi:CRP-like cAMP-binding protein
MGRSDREGKTVMSVVLKNGQSFGELTLFANLPRPFDAFAVGPTRINKISRAAFFQLMDQEPALRRSVLANLAIQVAGTLDQIDSLKRLPLRERVAKTLLEFALGTGQSQPEEGQRATAQATHGQLAEALGVTRVSIASALDSLIGLGLIVQAYGRIDIPDTRALERFLRGQGAI